MRYFITPFLLILSNYFNAQNVKLEWAVSFGSTSSDQGEDLSVDPNGNIFCVGSFYGTADFDPSSTTGNLTSSGNKDAYLVKLNEHGNLLWANSIGGTDADMGQVVTSDLNGDVYSGGRFSSTIDIDPGAGLSQLTSAGAYDIYLAKYHGSSGNFDWGFGLGGSGTEEIKDILFSSSGHVYICGTFNDTVDFDPGPGFADRVANSSPDTYLAKYTSTGQLVWVNSWGGTTSELISGLNENANGDILATGQFRGTLDFDPGTGTFNLSTGNFITHGFIMKLSPQGDFIWAKALVGDYQTAGLSLDSDANGNIYTAGVFSGTTDFDPGSGTQSFTSAVQDGYILKLQSNGDFLWAKVVTGNVDQRLHSIALDSVGNSYIGGMFEGSPDFDPGPGTHIIYSAGNADACILSLDSAGNFNWAKNVMRGAGSLDNACKRIITDAAGNLYATGYFSGTADTDPGSPVVNITSNGPWWDSYVHKLGACNSFSAMNITTCSSFISPSGLYTWINSGTYTDTISNTSGCDSIITVQLSINRPSSTIAASSCDFYTSPSGNIWNSSGTFTDTLSTSSGCDSIVIINLQIYQTASDTIAETACSSYTSPSGTYVWQNSGTYTDSLVNIDGCDSLLIINLSINNLDTSVLRQGPSFVANTANANYQWVDCNQNYAIINGENNQNFTPTVNGSYAVIITENGCTDTSSCHSINDVSLEEKGIMNLIVSPNPFKDELHLDLGVYQGPAELNIVNTGGQILFRKVFYGQRYIHFPFSPGPGIYLLKVSTATGRIQQTVKVVKL